MDIYTDASLNETQKIAGVGIVFVPDAEKPTEVLHFPTYVAVNKIDVAELFAIALALKKIDQNYSGNVRIVTDSANAVYILMRHFQNPESHSIDHVEDLFQKKILCDIAESLGKREKASFTVCLIKGHQRHADDFSDGYYNSMADDDAKTGRVYGENLKLEAERQNGHGIVPMTPEEKEILNHSETQNFRKIDFSLPKANSPKRPAKKTETKGCNKVHTPKRSRSSFRGSRR